MSLDGQLTSEETLGVPEETLRQKGFQYVNPTFLVKETKGYIQIYKRNKDRNYSLHRWGFLNTTKKRGA